MRKLGNITRHSTLPPKKQHEATSEWHDWYNETPKETYLLGRRASILAFATFEEMLLATDEAIAPHLFNLHVYADVDRDVLKYFCHAIHDDHDSDDGATWLELHPDGNTDTTLFATLNYRRLPVGSRVIMTRNA